MFKLINQQDLEDFTQGCCFFGTGGGGNPEFGQKMLRDALDAGKEIKIVSLNTLAGKEWIVCPYLMGTSGPMTEEIKQEKIKHGLSIETVRNMPTAATDLLLKTSGKTITLSAIIPYEIGAAATSSAVATARDNNKDPELILNEHTGAKKIFDGVISKFNGYEEQGYYVGDINISGENEYKGSKLKIWFRNENHIAWKDENVCLTSPDLIAIIDQITYLPYVNNQLKDGLHVSVYGIPSHKAWHEKIACEANSPKYYGFNFEAKFIER